MPSLKDLRNRISSVKATRKITKAMQMVAAAKLRRAQEAAAAGRPYAEQMDQVLINLNRSMSGTGSDGKTAGPKLLTGTGRDETHLLLVMTAERGLCGGFNSNIARLARADLVRLTNAGKTVKIICVGKKGYDVLRREFKDLIVDLVDLRAVKRLAYSDAEGVADGVFKLFDEGGFDVCTMYFARFKSVISQIPTGQQLIPAKAPDTATPNINAQDSAALGAEKSATPIDAFEYEPGTDEVLAYLLKRNIKTQIYRGLLENAASEQGARMSAMDSATRNAGEMIDKLTMTYNRQRQAQITKELIEIISGAEAL